MFEVMRVKGRIGKGVLRRDVLQKTLSKDHRTDQTR